MENLRRSARKRTASQRVVNVNDVVARNSSVTTTSRVRVTGTRPAPSTSSTDSVNVAYSTSNPRQNLPGIVIPQLSQSPSGIVVGSAPAVVYSTSAVPGIAIPQSPTGVGHVTAASGVSTTIGNSACNFTNLNAAIHTSSSNAILVMSSVTDELGLHVSQANREKIIKGEFIDLSVLLQNSQTNKPTQVINFVSGELVLQTKQQSKIYTVEQWTDAFLVFFCIFILAHPDKTQELLKYMNNIRIAEKRCGKGIGWKLYDENFRLKMAQNCNVSWGKIDLELWLLFVNQNSAVTEVSNTNTHKCYAYNYNGHCSRLNCTYSHCCIRCFAAHPLIHCYMYKAKNMGGVVAPVGSERQRFSGLHVRPQVPNFNFRVQHPRPRAPGAVMGQRLHPR